MKRQRLVGAGLVALGAGIAANALLGPLALRIIGFHNSASGIDQLMGGEAISLVVVAPLSVTAGVFWMRGHWVAPTLALAPALYALYTYTTEIVVAQYARYPGNSEWFLPLHIGLLALGGSSAVAAWSALEAESPLIPTSRLRVAAAAALLVPSALFALNWLRQLTAYTGGERSQEYRDDPILWWLIKGLDLGIIIPISLAVGIGVLRNRPVAARAASGMTGFLACLVGSVAAMGAVQVAKADPGASPALVAVAALMALGLGGVAIQLIRAESTRHRSAADTVTVPQPGISVPRLDAPSHTLTLADKTHYDQVRQGG
jgi:hypothetical protein